MSKDNGLSRQVANVALYCEKKRSANIFPASFALIVFPTHKQRNSKGELPHTGRFTSCHKPKILGPSKFFPPSMCEKAFYIFAVVVFLLTSQLLGSSEARSGNLNRKSGIRRYSSRLKEIFFFKVTELNSSHFQGNF